MFNFYKHIQENIKSNKYTILINDNTTDNEKLDETYASNLSDALDDFMKN